MEQTWFDLPVENRLTEVWPQGLIKRRKLVPKTCKTGDLLFPLPYWNLPVVSMDQKMPLLPGPKNLYHLSRSKLGQKLWLCEDTEFSLNESIQKEIFNAYEILHDPNLTHYLRRPKIVKRLKDLGLVDSELGVKCDLKEYNYYRKYLAHVNNNALNKHYKEEYIKGNSTSEMVSLTANLEKQNAKARINEEIEHRHADVFKEITERKRKRYAYCLKRLQRCENVFKQKQSKKEASQIAAKEAAKDFTKKLQENLFSANAQLRQHKLDTMRKWRMQNLKRDTLFQQMEKERKEGGLKKKTEWFQNKIKHQENRVLHETQINVLIDHEFSPEYKKYLKYIKRENFKNPPDHTTCPESQLYNDSDEDEMDILNQLKLITEVGQKFNRGSLISTEQAKKAVAKLPTSLGTYAQIKKLSEKYVKNKLRFKGKKKHTILDTIVNSSILKLISPSLQEVFKKSEPHGYKKSRLDSPSKVRFSFEQKIPTSLSKNTVDVNEDKLVSDEEDKRKYADSDPGSDIEIRPAKKTVPPPLICHLNVYRYLDRVLGKVILEYVTRILLPKFPEIINRCYWIAKAEGLPARLCENKVSLLCHPDDLVDSFSECIDKMKEACDQKLASHLLLLSETPDIRLFRHKFNGIGHITCPQSLVGNFWVQSSPHPQRILDYIHWRANGIVNYPTPKNYQEIYDLKYIIGVMNKIVSPVFQPIYKLWEITNDITLNQDILEKFILHLEKQKEHKHMLELNPVDIAVKNVRKVMGSLTMDYKVSKEVDKCSFEELFKIPSDLCRISYLKRPVDPIIWRTLDKYLNDPNQKPDDLECFKCLSEKSGNTELEVDLGNVEQNVVESLFYDSKDYIEEIKKAKDETKVEIKEQSHIRFGITEFIPFIEKQLFGQELSSAGDGEDGSGKEQQSILKESSARGHRKKLSKSFRKESAETTVGLSHQKKETDLPSKLKENIELNDLLKNEQFVRKKKQNEINGKLKASDVNSGNRDFDEKTLDTRQASMKSDPKLGMGTEDKKSKSKVKTSFIKLPGKEVNTKKQSNKSKLQSSEERSIYGKSGSSKDDYEKRNKLNLALEKSSSDTKKSGNVRFVSKQYVGAHILKSLEVADDLKRSTDRAPTPHPSFMSLDSIMKRSTSIGDDVAAQNQAAVMSALKYKLCKRDPDSDQSVQRDVASDNQTRLKGNLVEVPHASQPLLEDEPQIVEVPDVNTDGEIVLNTIQPETQELDVAELEDGSHSSLGFELNQLRKFVTSKLPHKLVVQDKPVEECPASENISVPPIVNNSLLKKRRMIKRPLANILHKIYGWVMTTVIRRRLLIYYCLPPKIKKECFYYKKFDAKKLDLARGLAKLILEQPTEYYSFSALEPFIEVILEQTMDETKRYDFTKRVIRMDTPLSDEQLESLKEFLQRTEEDDFFKTARKRRLKMLASCIKKKVDSIKKYGLLWGSKYFDPKEWEEIFLESSEEAPFICLKGKSRKDKLSSEQKIGLSYEYESTDFSSETLVSRDKELAKSDSVWKTQDKVLTRTEILELKKAREVVAWLKGDIPKRDNYDELRPGYKEPRISSRKKILNIIINKEPDVAPSITDISDEMRRDFKYHKASRKWLEKERQFKFITTLNLFNNILPPKREDRKMMKFVQSPTYPYHGRFLSLQTFKERREQPNITFKT